MKRYLLILALLSFTSIIVQSCHVGASGGWKDDHIDPNVRKEIEVLDKKLFESISTKDIAGVKSLMATVLLEKSGNQIDTLVNSVGDAFKTKDYQLLNEFYTKNTTTNIGNTVFSGLTQSDYIINYLALNEEMYVSVMVSKNLPVNFMVLAIYGKYKDGWKLNILHIGEYSMLGKTTPDYYNEALDFYHRGLLIDASDMIFIASQLANPAGTYLKYKNEDEMKSFYTKVVNEANTKYHFPIVVDQIKTKPQIFGISPQFIGEPGHQGIFPFIKYKSDIPLSDTVNLKIENQAIQKVIAGIFNNIDQNKDYILYRAFDRFPQANIPNSQIKSYGFIQKIAH
jgi:hypothetical protein